MNSSSNLLREPLLDAPPSDRRDGGQASSLSAAGAGAADDGLPLAPSTRGPTPGKYANPLLSVCPFILVNELCERLAYNG